jgi:hypothetical protein
VSTAVSFGHDHRIGNPCGMSHLAYQPGLLQLLNFLNDEVLLLWRLLSRLLLY